MSLGGAPCGRARRDWRCEPVRRVCAHQLDEPLRRSPTRTLTLVAFETASTCGRRRGRGDDRWRCRGKRRAPAARPVPAHADAATQHPHVLEEARRLINELRAARAGPLVTLRPCGVRRLGGVGLCAAQSSSRAPAHGRGRVAVGAAAQMPWMEGVRLGCGCLPPAPGLCSTGSSHSRTTQGARLVVVPELSACVPTTRNRSWELSDIGPAGGYRQRRVSAPGTRQKVSSGHGSSFGQTTSSVIRNASTASLTDG